MKKNEENTKTKNKPLSPIKLTPTSVLDYFGTESVQRSGKKMVASKRKEVGILHASKCEDWWACSLQLGEGSWKSIS